MRRIRIRHLILLLLLGTAVWLGYRALRQQMVRAPEETGASWEQIFARPVRSLAVLGDSLVLGTYQGSSILQADGRLVHLAAEPAGSDSPWAGAVFALAVDGKRRRVYEGRDQAYEVGMLDLREGMWQPLPRFGDSQRWTVWSLAVGDALYAGTGKGVWMHPSEPEGGWQLIGPPAGRARLPVFSLLYTEEGLYVGTFDGVWLYAEGEWHHLVDGPRAKVLALTGFTWKGRRMLAAGTGDGLFLQADADPWQRVEGKYAGDPVVYSLVFDERDGALFAGTADGVVRLDVASGEGPMRWEKVGLSGPVMALAWHDGALFAGGDGGVFVWRERR
ncbi:MAG: WD40 repeat domain-containing protein [Chloroflexi bacterium]|nr:WD40 repeat domain-containing protein [Chloroflexota bacterium]